MATGWSTGVPQPTALANGWLLKDSSGALLTNAGYPGMYVGDVGSASYQQAWVTNVTSLLSRNANDGVFIDDVLGEITGLTGGKYPAKYPSQASWENAMASFMAYVGPALKAKGFYVLANVHKYVSGDAGTDNGSLEAQWWQRIGPFVSGLMSENWSQNPLDTTKLRGTGPEWWNNWEGWANLVSVAQSMGRDFVGLQYAASTNTRVMTYGKASFLLFWNGGGGAYMFNPDGGGDPWNAAWTTDVGLPTAARYKVGVGWRRDYSGGTVLVNPSATASQTFSLGATYAKPDGTKVTSVTLAATTAMILQNAEQPAAGSQTQPPVNTSLIQITGNLVAGQTVTVSTGTWANSPTSYAYQWLRCDSSGTGCVTLPAATSAYTLTASEVGHTLRATVVATNMAGAGTATTAPTAIVGAATLATLSGGTPINTARPAISGRAEVGQVLSVSTGSWTPAPTSYLYAWHRCNASGGNCALSPTSTTDPTYEITSADAGFTLVAQVAPNGIWGASVNPPATAVVAAAPALTSVVAAPAISGALPAISGVLRVGSRLSASTGNWSGAPSSFNYQWYRCGTTGQSCEAIPGAVGSSYVVASADKGSTLRVSVVAVAAGGSATATSSAVGPVPRSKSAR